MAKKTVILSRPSNTPVTVPIIAEDSRWIIAVGKVRYAVDFHATARRLKQAPAKVVLGKGSGIDSIKNALRKLGVQATEEEAMSVVSAVKEFSLRHKRLLTDQEFRSIVSSTLPQKAAKGAKTAV